MPAGYNKYYDFAEQGVVADYVIIMAYDEHYSGSAEAGSVSSISYVENAIRDTKEMVPADKIIVALPFYTRLWKETHWPETPASSLLSVPIIYDGTKEKIHKAYSPSFI